MSNGFDIVSYDLRTSSVKGSPMLLSSWSQGELVLPDSKRINQVPLKYDVYRQQLRVRRPQGDSIIVPVVQVQEFSLTGLNAMGNIQARRFVRYANPSLPTELSGGCAEVLTEGQHVQLIKFWRRSIIKVSENSTNMALSSSAKEFHNKDKYYLRWTSDGHVAPLRLKNGSLQGALAGQPAALAALKARKKSTKSEIELAAGVAAVDGLITN